MSDTDPDAVIPLQEWLKLLQTHGVPMRVGMTLAAKAYKDHNTRAKLGKLPVDKFVGEKEQRKVVTNAIKGVSSGLSAKKKRARDDDLLHALEPVTPTLPKSLDFNEILDPEQLIPITVTCNRAPIKTAWAYTVARRLGFDAQEALSLAHVYVHIGSMKHALALGNIYDATQTRDAEEEIRELPGEHDYKRPGAPTSPVRRRWEKPEPKAVGSSQPWVMLLRTKIPVIERPDGTWRAIQKGVSVEPSVAYLYITRALKTFTPHVMGAMQLVANSYAPDELNMAGVSIYSAFKPDVVEWGQRGGVSVADILNQIKSSGEEEAGETGQAGQAAGDDEMRVAQETTEKTAPRTPRARSSGSSGSSLSPAPSIEGEVKKADEEGERLEKTATGHDPDPQGPPAKRQKEMTLEEYEAMLDDDDFLDADLSNLP